MSNRWASFVRCCFLLVMAVPCTGLAMNDDNKRIYPYFQNADVRIDDDNAWGSGVTQVFSPPNTVVRPTTWKAAIKYALVIAAISPFKAALEEVFPKLYRFFGTGAKSFYGTKPPLELGEVDKIINQVSRFLRVLRTFKEAEEGPNSSIRAINTRDVPRGLEEIGVDINKDVEVDPVVQQALRRVDSILRTVCGYSDRFNGKNFEEITSKLDEICVDLTELRDRIKSANSLRVLAEEFHAIESSIGIMINTCHDIKGCIDPESVKSDDDGFGGHGKYHGF